MTGVGTALRAIDWLPRIAALPTSGIAVLVDARGVVTAQQDVDFAPSHTHTEAFIYVPAGPGTGVYAGVATVGDKRAVTVAADAPTATANASRALGGTIIPNTVVFNTRAQINCTFKMQMVGTGWIVQKGVQNAESCDDTALFTPVRDPLPGVKIAGGLPIYLPVLLALLGSDSYLGLSSSQIEGLKGSLRTFMASNRSPYSNVIGGQITGPPSVGFSLVEGEADTYEVLGIDGEAKKLVTLSPQTKAASIYQLQQRDSEASAGTLPRVLTVVTHGGKSTIMKVTSLTEPYGREIHWENTPAHILPAAELGGLLPVTFHKDTVKDANPTRGAIIIQGDPADYTPIEVGVHPALVEVGRVLEALHNPVSTTSSPSRSFDHVQIRRLRPIGPESVILKGEDGLIVAISGAAGPSASTIIVAGVGGNDQEALGRLANYALSADDPGPEINRLPPTKGEPGYEPIVDHLVYPQGVSDHRTRAIAQLLSAFDATTRRIGDPHLPETPTKVNPGTQIHFITDGGIPALDYQSKLDLGDGQTVYRLATGANIAIGGHTEGLPFTCIGGTKIYLGGKVREMAVHSRTEDFCLGKVSVKDGTVNIMAGDSRVELIRGKGETEVLIPQVKAEHISGGAVRVRAKDVDTTIKGTRLPRQLGGYGRSRAPGILRYSTVLSTIILFLIVASADGFRMVIPDTVVDRGVASFGFKFQTSIVEGQGLLVNGAGITHKAYATLLTPGQITVTANVPSYTPARELPLFIPSLHNWDLHACRPYKSLISIESNKEPYCDGTGCTNDYGEQITTVVPGQAISHWNTDSHEAVASSLAFYQSHFTDNFGYGICWSTTGTTCDCNEDVLLGKQDFQDNFYTALIVSIEKYILFPCKQTGDAQVNGVDFLPEFFLGNDCQTLISGAYFLEENPNVDVDVDRVRATFIAAGTHSHDIPVLDVVGNGPIHYQYTLDDEGVAVYSGYSRTLTFNGVGHDIISVGCATKDCLSAILVISDPEGTYSFIGGSDLYQMGAMMASARDHARRRRGVWGCIITCFGWGSGGGGSCDDCATVADVRKVDQKLTDAINGLANKTALAMTAEQGAIASTQDEVDALEASLGRTQHEVSNLTGLVDAQLTSVYNVLQIAEYKIAALEAHQLDLIRSSNAAREVVQRQEAQIIQMALSLARSGELPQVLVDIIKSIASSIMDGTELEHMVGDLGEFAIPAGYRKVNDSRVDLDIELPLTANATRRLGFRQLDIRKISVVNNQTVSITVMYCPHVYTSSSTWISGPMDPDAWAGRSKTELPPPIVVAHPTGEVFGNHARNISVIPTWTNSTGRNFTENPLAPNMTLYTNETDFQLWRGHPLKQMENIPLATCPDPEVVIIPIPSCFTPKGGRYGLCLSLVGNGTNSSISVSLEEPVEPSVYDEHAIQSFEAVFKPEMERQLSNIHTIASLHSAEVLTEGAYERRLANDKENVATDLSVAKRNTQEISQIRVAYSNLTAASSATSTGDCDTSGPFEWLFCEIKQLVRLLIQIAVLCAIIYLVYRIVTWRLEVRRNAQEEEQRNRLAGARASAAEMHRLPMDQMEMALSAAAGLPEQVVATLDRMAGVEVVQNLRHSQTLTKVIAHYGPALTEEAIIDVLRKETLTSFSKDGDAYTARREMNVVRLVLEYDAYTS
jgi:hypothetical protein